MGIVAMNCPRNKGKISAPIAPATVMKPPILLVTVMYWFIHNMQLANIGAVPMPMNAVKAIKASIDTSPNIANRELPTILIKKLNASVPIGLIFAETKMATNRMVVNEPQNTAVILAPICLERCNLDCTENVARNMA